MHNGRSTTSPTSHTNMIERYRNGTAPSKRSWKATKNASPAHPLSNKNWVSRLNNRLGTRLFSFAQLRMKCSHCRAMKSCRADLATLGINDELIFNLPGLTAKNSYMCWQVCGATADEGLSRESCCLQQASANSLYASIFLAAAASVSYH